MKARVLMPALILVLIALSVLTAAGVRVIQAASGGGRAVSSPMAGSIFDSSPTWISGGRVAFVRQDRDSETNRLMLVDRSGRETELIRDRSGEERLQEQLTASPDGRTLAWIGNFRLFSTRLDRPRMRFVGRGGRYSWAPTSRLLVVADELGINLFA